MLPDDRDRVRLRDGSARAVELVWHPAVAPLADLPLAGHTSLDELADQPALDAWMHATVTNYAHSVGTCRMSRPDDPAAVVDLDCQLIGYHGLRVVDASVLPDLPRANTHLTVLAIAERPPR